MALATRILLGLVAGLILGLLARGLGGETPSVAWFVDNIAAPAGQIFLRLLFLLVIPLLFSALVVGIADLEPRRLGRMGLRVLGYAVGISFTAVILGMTLVNIWQPGVGGAALLQGLNSSALPALPKPPEVHGSAFFVAMIPDNPIKVAANGDMVGVIIFALLFGLGLSYTSTPGAARVREGVQGLYDVSLTLINGVLKLAPFGVAALVFVMAMRLGSDLLSHVLAYVGVVLLGLSLHLFAVYAFVLRVFGRYSPWAFFRNVRLAMATAFATASSSATLPTALKVAEENLRLPPHVSRFVLTAGTAMNQNGTALFEGVTVLFLAQLFGVDLSVTQQLLIMGLCVLAGIGTAGVPAGSLPVIAMILALFNIPAEGLALILGVDRLLDMCRTVVNVTGDLVIAVCMAREENAATRDDSQ